MNTFQKIVNFSFMNKSTHVPSALSMATYVNFLFKNKIVIPYRDKIVLGKPFGSQTYYVIWEELGYVDDIEKLSIGVKHGEVDFVDYSEETMGNALGVAAGIAISNPDKKVWVNLTDATLQMGSTLEALQYIGQNMIKNIFVTIDNNNTQVTGETNDIIKINPVFEMVKNYDWHFLQIDGHNEDEMLDKLSDIENGNKPVFVSFLTKKGYGIKYMEDDPVKWHYKPMEINEI